MFVAIAGNIGSGKSSLTTLLSQDLRWRAFYEIVEQNPYLSDFYEDMPRWSFHTQMFFLSRRFRHLKEIQNANEPVIQDRSIYEDAEVFAKTLYLRGEMEERDYRTYSDHFQIMQEYFRPPDLVVYLKCDIETLVARISKRGRRYENSIDREYLEKLNEVYEDWATHYRHGAICTVDVSRRDFVNKAEDLRQIVSMIKWDIECLQNPSQTSLPLRSSSRGMDLIRDPYERVLTEPQL